MRSRRWAGIGMFELGSFVLASFVVGIVLGAPTAQAFRMSVAGLTSSGASTSILALGDTVTIDLVVENETQRPILAIGLIAYGYDVDRNRLADDGLRMVGASAVDSVFNTIRLSDGQVFGGAVNVRGPQEFADQKVTGGGPYMGVYTVLFASASLTPVGSGYGSLDTGLGGRSIAEGDVHFRIAFQATSLFESRILTLRFGSGPTSGPDSYGWGALVREGDTYPVLPVEDALLMFTVLADPNAVPPSGGGGTPDPGGDPNPPPTDPGGNPYPIVPEPGPALLLGLGLAGLAGLAAQGGRTDSCNGGQSKRGHRV